MGDEGSADDYISVTEGQDFAQVKQHETKIPSHPHDAFFQSSLVHIPHCIRH